MSRAIESPVAKSRFSVQEMALCGLFSALVAIGAFLRIPIPPVPVAFQFLFANLAGLLLGGRLGALAVGSYLVIGLMGVPIFTRGGGLGYIFEPTFGYLIGYFFGTAVTGWISRRFGGRFISDVLAGVANISVVYLLGASYLYVLYNYYLNSPIGARTVMISCVLIFVPADMMHCVLSAFIARRVRPVLQRKRDGTEH